MVQASPSSSIDVSSWDNITIKQVKIAAQKANQEGKYLFIWDKNGNVATFFKYAGSLCDFDAEVVKTGAGQQTALMAL